MSHKIPISVIVPVYNEGSNITLFLQTLEKTVKIKHEVLIIFDFYEDDTLPVVKKLKKQFTNIRLAKNKFGTGVINACKTGFIESKGNSIVVIPGDLVLMGSKPENYAESHRHFLILPFRSFIPSSVV